MRRAWSSRRKAEAVPVKALARVVDEGTRATGMTAAQGERLGVDLDELRKLCLSASTPLGTRSRSQERRAGTWAGRQRTSAPPVATGGCASPLRMHAFVRRKETHENAERPRLGTRAWTSKPPGGRARPRPPRSCRPRPRAGSPDHARLLSSHPRSDEGATGDRAMQPAACDAA